MKTKYPDLYKKHFVDKGDERLELFRVIHKEFKLNNGLYPGSFAHITPSLVIQQMVYVDSDTRCKKFYEDTLTREFVISNKEYDSQPIYRFHHADYSKYFDEDENSFDLLVSLYAGFVSKHCQKYLKIGGILLANNSHGDAPLAYLDENFDFIGIVKRSSHRFKFSKESLESYFITKSGKEINKIEIEKTMRGPGYTKAAYAYVFKKVNR
ncbi:hypothetical protein ACFLRX_10260 [Acidobacteriota bacterium]